MEREGTFEKQYKTKLHIVAKALAKVLAAGQTGRFVLTDAVDRSGPPSTERYRELRQDLPPGLWKLLSPAPGSSNEHIHANIREA